MEVEPQAAGLRLSRRAAELTRGFSIALKYRLLAVDLDGTLLDASGRVHARDREAIEQLARRGVPTTIITGRLFSGSRHVATEIGALGPIGCADGSHIVHGGSGEELLHAGIAGEHALRLREVIEKAPAVSFLFAQDQIVHDGQGEPYLAYVRTWSRDFVRASQVVAHPHWEHPRGVTGMVALGERECIDEIRAELDRDLDGVAQTVTFPVRRGEHDGTWVVLVRAAGTTKGTALEKLAEHHGITTEEVVVVGDWYNDLPMFERAGRSFAMGQAPEAIKRAASDRLEADVTTGGGILEAAERVGWLWRR